MMNRYLHLALVLSAAGGLLSAMAVTLGPHDAPVARTADAGRCRSNPASHREVVAARDVVPHASAELKGSRAAHAKAPKSGQPQKQCARIESGQDAQVPRHA
jgi:hypothetical protein